MVNIWGKNNFQSSVRFINVKVTKLKMFYLGEKQDEISTVEIIHYSSLLPLLLLIFLLYLSVFTKYVPCSQGHSLFSLSFDKM